MKYFLILALAYGGILHSLNTASAYRKGNYRVVVENIGKKNSPSPRELYLLGQSQLELRRTNEAWSVFSRIDYKKFHQKKDTSFLYPFYVDAYLKAGFSQNAIAQPAARDSDVLAMAALVPADHPVKELIDDHLLAFLWKEKNYPAMMLADANLSPQGKVWIELAKFAQGLPYDLKVITSSWRALSNSLVYKDLIASINPKDLKDGAAAKMFAEIAIGIPDMHEQALAFALRYFQLTKDRELPVTIRNQMLIAQGRPDEAAKVLYDHFSKEKKGSLTLFRMAQNQLIRREMLKEALEVGRLGYVQHGRLFSTEYAVILESQKKPDAILAWYRNNYKTSSEELHNQVFRSLIRSTRLPLAESALDLGYGANSNFASYHLMRALVKERLGKKEEAYKAYLEAMVLEPFGYAGVTARPRELAMRAQYRSLFDARLAKVRTLLKEGKIQQRLMTAKAFLMDKELAPEVDKAALRRDQADHDRIIEQRLNIEPLPALEKIDKRLTNYGPEMQAFLENTVYRAAQKSGNRSDIARYYYKYRELFTDTDITGYLTFRLYFYLRDIYGGATYLPIFSKELLALAYPRPEWNIILKESGGNEDLAYWMLSSFHQESHFRKRVFSHVGAVGFAQVMGYTARDIKNWMRQPHMENTDFVDNLTMGIYYHSRMYRFHDNNHIFGMAAYNAGPGRVRTWRQRYASYLDDMALFTEAIDIRETRIYVRIVSYNRTMYDIIYNRPDLWL